MFPGEHTVSWGKKLAQGHLKSKWRVRDLSLAKSVLFQQKQEGLQGDEEEKRC